MHIQQISKSQRQNNHNNSVTLLPLEALIQNLETINLMQKNIDKIYL